MTNVAENAAETLPLSGVFPITFTALTQLGQMTSGGGPSPAEIDSPITLEFNHFRGNVVRDRNFRQYDQACTMVLAGDSIRLTGGCNGKGRMSIGWSRGDLTGPDWA